MTEPSEDHCRTTPSRIDEILHYELKVAQDVRSMLGQQAVVMRFRVLKGPNLRTAPDFDRQVESAGASAAITEDESDEFLLLDRIISGIRTGTTERVYAGIEGIHYRQ